MGGTKIKIIDDSLEKESPKESKKTKGPKVEQEPTDVVLGSRQPAETPESRELNDSGQARMTAENEITDSRMGDDKPQEKKSAKKKAVKKGELASTAKPGGPKHRSKKYLDKAELVEKSKKYPVQEAVELAKQTSYSKFGASLEIHLNTAIKNVRGLVNLPHLSGKELRILAFGPSAADSGATMIGDDTKLDEIAKGKVDFDVLVAHPSWMPKLARVAKVLGPKGLMPNPKNGTVSDNLAKAVSELQGGKTEFRTENNLTAMHLRIGDLNQPTEELVANLKTLYGAIGKSKVKSATLAASMGPGVKVDLGTL